MGSEGRGLRKNWLIDFVELASVGEAPRQFAFWSGVFAISAALERRVYLPMGAFDWIPNFYIILVAPPGMAVKSTTINLARGLLEEAEACTFGPSSLTWQALTDVMAEAQNGRDYAAVALCVSELGTFLDPADSKLVDVLTDLWDGSRREWWHRTRGNRGEPIRNPSITMIAATTPSWLQAHVRPEMMEGGLASRCIFAVAERKERLVAYPGLVMPGEEWQRRRDSLLFRLEAIRELEGEFRLSPEAVRWGEAWYGRHWRREPPAMLGGWWARKQAHLHKLAMILAVAEGAGFVLQPEHLEMAARILDETEVGIVRVHQLIETTETGRLLSAIEAAVRESPGMRYEELFAAFRHRVAVGEFNEAITALYKAKRIEIRRSGSEVCLFPAAPLREEPRNVSGDRN